MKLLGALPFVVLAAITIAKSDGASAKSERVVTVMSYNAENLFDTDDNPNNTGDNTYLPKSKKASPEHKAYCEKEFATSTFYKKECLELDWSQAVLAAKLKNLAAVIDAFDGGNGPDVLVLQEVENLNAVKLLTDTLKNGPTYVTRVNPEESPGRGINVALISKLPLAGAAKSHDVEFDPTDAADCGDTRDILEVPLKLPDGASLTVYGIHFPSGGNPTKCRQRASEKLNQLVSAKPKDAMLIALGDSNINCTPEDQTVISNTLRDQWIVPDEVGKGCRPPGSNFYPREGQWSFLDLILSSRSLTSSSQEGAPWFADYGSFRTAITAPEAQVETDPRNRVKPMRFDAEKLTGTSDHWPVAIDLIRRR